MEENKALGESRCAGVRKDLHGCDRRPKQERAHGEVVSVVVLVLLRYSS